MWKEREEEDKWCEKRRENAEMKQKIMRIIKMRKYLRDIKKKGMKNNEVS